MKDAPYSNREIREFFKDIKETLARIEAQTVKTNGRVSKLEFWRAIQVGALTIISVVVIPLVVYVFNISIAK